MAINTLCRSPPDMLMTSLCCNFASPVLSIAHWTISSSSLTFFWKYFLCGILPYAISSFTVISSGTVFCWCTVAISLAMSLYFILLISLSLMIISPDEILFKPHNKLNTVDFPLPFGPSIVVIFPFSILKVKSLINSFFLS